MQFLSILYQALFKKKKKNQVFVPIYRRIGKDLNKAEESYVLVFITTILATLKLAGNSTLYILLVKMFCYDFFVLTHKF